MIHSLVNMKGCTHKPVLRNRIIAAQNLGRAFLSHDKICEENL